MPPLLPVETIDIAQLADKLEAIIQSSRFGPIAVQNHDQAVAYLISAPLYEDLLNTLDDLELASVVHSRREEVGLPHEIDDL
jgi:antitoxin StbD